MVECNSYSHRLIKCSRNDNYMLDNNYGPPRIVRELGNFLIFDIVLGVHSKLLSNEHTPPCCSLVS